MRFIGVGYWWCCQGLARVWQVILRATSRRRPLAGCDLNAKTGETMSSGLMLAWYFDGAQNQLASNRLRISKNFLRGEID